VKSYTLSQIERWRDRTHRRLPRLRIRSRRQAIRFVNDVGFCFLFKTAEPDLPSLANALEGGADGSNPGRGPGASSFSWDLRGILPDERDAFCAKVFLRRPMLVSMEYLPYFMALSDRRESAIRTHSRKPDLSSTAQHILEQLRRKSPQTTHDLRHRLSMSAGTGKGAFDLALTDLQVRMKIAALEDDRRPSSALWALSSRKYPVQTRRARSLSIEEARRAILERHFRNQLVLTFADIKHLFRWERREIFQTLGELIRRGIVTPEVQVEGIADRTYCLLT